jgi:hypothetical protein
MNLDTKPIKNITILIKVILAVIFAIAAFNLPYSYYQIVKVIGMFGLLYLAYYSYKTQSETLSVIFVILAIIFNPFPALKISFSKEIWRVMDIIVSIVVLVSIFINPNKDKEG